MSSLTPMTRKRISTEIADLRKNKQDLGSIILEPTDNVLIWKASIPGPEGSPYEGGIFDIDIRLNDDYPFSAPRIAFLTRVYHMNINDRGGICLDILKHNWSPALSLFKVVLSISSLLTDPNPRDPLVPSIAKEYTRSRAQHDSNARHWTELYAKPPSSPPIQNKPMQSSSKTQPNQGRPVQPLGSNQVIVIEDSDEESSTQERSRPPDNKRKRKDNLLLGSRERSESARSVRRRHDTPTNQEGTSTFASAEVIVIDD